MSQILSVLDKPAFVARISDGSTADKMNYFDEVSLQSILIFSTVSFTPR